MLHKSVVQWLSLFAGGMKVQKHLILSLTWIHSAFDWAEIHWVILLKHTIKLKSRRDFHSTKNANGIYSFHIAVTCFERYALQCIYKTLATCQMWCDATYPLSNRTSSWAFPLFACVHHLLNTNSIPFLSISTQKEWHNLVNLRFTHFSTWFWRVPSAQVGPTGHKLISKDWWRQNQTDQILCTNCYCECEFSVCL